MTLFCDLTKFGFGSTTGYNNGSVLTSTKRITATTTIEFDNNYVSVGGTRSYIIKVGKKGA
ncbi:hypothetical protein DICPUDRAFT_158076 [Dictyostelium purpureum]|uniref:Uncharacterized protein n=1 Tax=Dictyostelium purpureum TaxID=5786 RepID=F1A0S1_DICPU|nr:uncharacterized protein DICPUDRAFT_158076 [Dictyostelium purpureum]EGC30198.1 hypothetical protein DICPUDRAFT_158076 [Dictyostelium purpureum]|eukprot:XP_003293261.1 hypothetical protein DICPUDRAFT_158076 [Dictyostelium purpureum]